MAARTWTSAGSNDMNDGANYSGAGALLAADDLTFDGTSVVNAAATANLAVNSVTIAAAYTGTWALTGFTATFGNGFSDDGTVGAHNYGNSITCNGASGTFHVGAGVGAVTASLCCVYFSGTTAMVLDDDKGVQFDCLVLIGAAKLTSSGSVSTSFSKSGTPLVLGDGASLTLNQTTNFFSTSSGSALYSFLGAYTFKGSGTITFYAATNAGTFSAPALTFTGTSSNFGFIANVGVNNAIINQTGNIVTNTVSTFRIYAGIANTSVTWNTQGFGISCTGSTFRWGASIATGTIVFNCGASTIAGAVYSPYTVGTGTINMGTAVFNFTGSWTFGATNTVNPGTSSVTITGTSTLTSNGKSFFDLTINSVALAVTCADALTLAAGGDLTLTSGTLNLNTFALTVGGNTAINGTSTLNATGSTCSFAGNYTTAAGTTITINAATNYTFTLNGAIVTTNGKALPQITFNSNFSINDTCTITRLIRGVDGFTGTFEAGQTFTISNLAAANWSGAAAALNTVRSSVPGTQFTMVIPNAATLTFYDSQDCIYQGFDITANDGTSITGGNNVRYLTFNVVTVLPIQGTTAGGTLITLSDTGNGMGGTMVVTVGGAGAGAETIVDTQNLTATTPAGVAGAQNIVITNGDGDTRTLVGAYTYVEPAGGPVTRESRCWVSAAVGI